MLAHVWRNVRGDLLGVDPTLVRDGTLGPLMVSRDFYMLSGS